MLAAGDDNITPSLLLPLHRRITPANTNNQQPLEQGQEKEVIKERKKERERPINHHLFLQSV